VRRGLGAAILTACAALPTQALALWEDSVTPFVEEKATRDSNVFRLSKSVDPSSLNPNPFTESSSRGDTYTTTVVGLNVDLPVSRQRFQLGYSRNFVRYDRFTQLDLDGYDGKALWQWQLGNDASGQLSYAESFGLASFTNVGGTTPDPLTQRQALFNGAYMVTPRWRAQAGVGGFQQRNGDPARQTSDIDIVSGDTSLSYTTPASTAVGLGLRAEEGRYPSRPFVSKEEDPAGIGSIFDNAYRQYGVDLVGDWTATGVSHLSARVGRVSRRNEHLPERDFYGTAVRVQYDWKPTGKLSLNTTVVQDISPYDDIKASYVFVKGVSFRPTFSLTGKIDLSGIFEYSRREYFGDPNLVPSLASPGSAGRIDRVRSSTATLSYRPLRALALQLSAQRESRSSTIPFGDYEVTVLSISAKLSF
jgi:exopolysaccharide biosynthesis operon protein EpsL